MQRGSIPVSTVLRKSYPPGTLRLRRSLFRKSVIVSFRSAPEMNATNEYFSVVLFVMLYQVVLTSVCERNPKNVIIEMKATNYNFSMALLVMLYQVVLTSVCERNPKNVIIEMKATNYNFSMALLVMLYQVVLTSVCERNPKNVIIEMKATNYNFSMALLVTAVPGSSNFSLRTKSEECDN